MRSTARTASTSKAPYGKMIPWREVRIDDSDDALAEESDVHSDLSYDDDDNYSTAIPLSVSTSYAMCLTKWRALRLPTVHEEDEEDSPVSDNEHDYAPDDDVQEEPLEMPEEFLLAKPHELDVEDELEGDFKCVPPVGSQSPHLNAL